MRRGELAKSSSKERALPGGTVFEREVDTGLVFSKEVVTELVSEREVTNFPREELYRVWKPKDDASNGVTTQRDRQRLTRHPGNQSWQARKFEGCLNLVGDCLPKVLTGRTEAPCMCTVELDARLAASRTRSA